MIIMPNRISLAANVSKVKKAFNLILFLALTTVAWSQQDSSVIKSDSVYKDPEITAAYPGGPIAWKRYLDKNLDNSFASAIQGAETVVVQFIVDAKGNVSNVKAISGPPGRFKEAERLVKKSGRWTPGVQGGRQVKSYTTISVLFQD